MPHLSRGSLSVRSVATRSAGRRASGFRNVPLLCVALLLALSFLAPGRCGAQQPYVDVAEEELLRKIRAPWAGDLDGMKARRYVRVLVTYSRTNFYLDGAVTKGLTAESFKIFEQWLNRKLDTGKYPIHVAFIPVKRDELLSALNSGLGDIAAAGLSVTEGRRQSVDFSDPWAEDVREVLVTGPASPELPSLDELSGKQIYVRPSSSYHESLVALNARFAAQGRPPVEIVPADESLESEDIMEMVGTGIVPMTVVDKYRADLWAKVIPNVRVRDDLQVAGGREIAWAVRKGSPQLLALVNEFVKAYRYSSDSAHLGRKYFVKTGYLLNPTASEDMRRFRDAASYFRKYGEKYDLDELLIAAQAYQESRLDQSARSPYGAVGVMQILPSTAAGSPIFLPDVGKLETNIHAGVKYHRHIIDTYFRDPALSQVNRMLFAFAAYNAGPANVARMRRLAGDMGLDPNQWFGNVELAAGRVAGQETVRYVGNIYKYYVAYSLVGQQARERSRTKAASPE